MIKVIASGSTANAVLYNRQSVLVDVGVPFKALLPYLREIKVVCLTHEHSDHLNKSTLKKLIEARPSIRIVCGEWMVPHLGDIKAQIHILPFGRFFSMGTFDVAIGKLYHDVQNCFYRFNFGGYKVFHATDTAHLKGIVAKDYDLYAIEHNYCEEKADQIIEEAYKKGEYTHLVRSVNSHLSVQSAQAWLLENAHIKSVIVPLHESKTAR